MSKMAEEEKMERFFRIYDHIHDDPLVRIYELPARVKMARNTVSAYLKEMHSQTILIGPRLILNPALNYREYVYLLNTDNPLSTLETLKKSPHTIYAAVTFGDWNVMAITDSPLDVGADIQVVKKGVRGFTSTPKVQWTTWDRGLDEISEKIQSGPETDESEPVQLSRIDWTEDEWKLYCAFSHLRKGVTPVLRKHLVPYQTYLQWMKGLKTHCHIEVRFCPHGFQNTVKYYFLISTGYKSFVKSLFSLLPSSPLITEVDSDLLISTGIYQPKSMKELLRILYEMREQKLIERLILAGIISDHEGEPFPRFFETVAGGRMKLRPRENLDRLFIF